MASDQEWCLECGAARTIIHGPPDWRIPLLILGVVAALILAGLAIALVSLSSSASQTTVTATAPGARRAAKTARTQATASPTTSTPVASGAAIGDWPLGLPGWTVVLATTSSEASARSLAGQLGTTGTSVGILNSSDHPSMSPGHWIVFSGRYPTGSAARAAANALRAQGQSTAQAVLVGRPGA